MRHRAPCRPTLSSWPTHDGNRSDDFFSPSRLLRRSSRSAPTNVVVKDAKRALIVVCGEPCELSLGPPMRRKALPGCRSPFLAASPFLFGQSSPNEVHCPAWVMFSCDGACGLCCVGTRPYMYCGGRQPGHHVRPVLRGPMDSTVGLTGTRPRLPDNDPKGTSFVKIELARQSPPRLCAAALCTPTTFPSSTRTLWSILAASPAIRDCARDSDEGRHRGPLLASSGAAVVAMVEESWPVRGRRFYRRWW